MKKYILSVFLVLLVVSLNAQDQTPTPTRTPTSTRPAPEYKVPVEDLDALKENLGLSDEQAQKWTEVSQRFLPKFEELVTVDSLEERGKIAASRKIQREKEAELKQFIFASQWDTYVAMKRKNRRAGFSKKKGFIKREKELKKDNQKEKGGG